MVILGCTKLGPRVYFNKRNKFYILLTLITYCLNGIVEISSKFIIYRVHNVFLGNLKIRDKTLERLFSLRKQGALTSGIKKIAYFINDRIFRAFPDCPRPPQYVSVPGFNQVTARFQNVHHGKQIPSTN